jgi:hypothetical protein
MDIIGRIVEFAQKCVTRNDVFDGMRLDWSEGMWMLEPIVNGVVDRMSCGISVKLGEAGNPAYSPKCFPKAMRIMDEVIVTSSDFPDGVIIPASTKVKGFGPEKDGKSLNHIMEEDVIYDFTLSPLR